MKKYIITIISTTIVILLFFGGYYIYSNSKLGNTSTNLEEKVNQEIKHLNTKIISMLNQLNNITYANLQVVEEQSPSNQTNTETGGQNVQGQQGSGQSQSQNQTNTTTNMYMKDNSILVNTDKKINWDNIKKEAEQIYQEWPTVLIDLNSLNVNQDNLKQYTTLLDNVTIAVQKEDKKQTATCLANLYAMVVSYVKDYSNDSKNNNLLDTKTNIVFGYALVESGNWDEMKKHIKSAQNSYMYVMNGGVENSSNISNINKIYVLLNEIEKSADTRDKSIFYINYKNLMQELDIIEG